MTDPLYALQDYVDGLIEIFPTDPVQEFVNTTLNGEFSPDQKAVIAKMVHDFLAENLSINQDDYRRAATRFVRILVMIDSAMSQSRDPKREWRAIALGLGLPSVCFSGLTEAELARKFKCSKMAISLRIKRFLGDEFKPAFGTGRYPGWKGSKLDG